MRGRGASWQSSIRVRAAFSHVSRRLLSIPRLLIRVGTCASRLSAPDTHNVAEPALNSSNGSEGPSLNRHEPLHPLAGEDLTSIAIALRIHGDHVQPEDLAPVFAQASHLAHDFAILAVEEPDVIIREIGNV